MATGVGTGGTGGVVGGSGRGVGGEATAEGRDAIGAGAAGLRGGVALVPDAALGAGVVTTPAEPAGPRGIGGGPEATLGPTGALGDGVVATRPGAAASGALRRSTCPGWIRNGSPMPFQRAISRQSRLLRKAMPYSVSPACTTCDGPRGRAGPVAARGALV